MKTRVAGISTLLVALLAAGASAQTAWETPFLMAPGGGDGLGGYLMDVSSGGLGALVTYRRVGAPVGLGIRGGLADETGGDVGIFGGVDFAGPLVNPTDEMPITVIWVAGAGAGVGNEIAFSFPAGVSVGALVEGESVQLLPYATPRLILDAVTGGGGLDLSLAFDFGLNLMLDNGWELRFAASVADRDGIAVGVGFPR